MGLTTRNSDSKTFLNVYDGKFAVQVKDPVEGSVMRVNKNGRTVHELYYDSLTNCILISASIVSDDVVGQKIVLDLLSEGEIYNLSVPLESRYAKSLMWKLPFIDLDAKNKFALTPFSFENEEGKRQTGFSITQGAEKIQSGYTKEEVPQAEQKRKGKDMVWDFTEQTNFLVDKFEEWAGKITRPSIPAKAAPSFIDEDEIVNDAHEAAGAVPSMKQAILDKNNRKNIPDVDDDLPF
jgi:hypothetical protein